MNHDSRAASVTSSLLNLYVMMLLLCLANKTYHFCWNLMQKGQN